MSGYFRLTPGRSCPSVSFRMPGEARVWLPDAGPLLHCVVWNDGEKWLAAVDSSDMYAADSGQGRLAGCEPLTDFDRGQRFGTFSAEDACNYGVHIYDQGNVLSLVVESGG